MLMTIREGATHDYVKAEEEDFAGHLLLPLQRDL